jgi:hypothetical protein
VLLSFRRAIDQERELFKNYFLLLMVAHTSNPSTGKMEMGGWQVSSHEQQSEILSQTNHK